MADFRAFHDPSANSDHITDEMQRANLYNEDDDVVLDDEKGDLDPDMKRTRIVRSLLALALVSTTWLWAAGCGKGHKLKDELIESLESGQAVDYYRFHGNAELNLRANAEATPSSPADALIPSLTRAGYRFHGAVDGTAGRWEMNLDIQQASSDASLSLPMMLAENRLYFTLPIPGLSETFWEVRLADIASDADPFSAGRSLSAILRLIASDMDARWFDEPDGDSDLRRIRLRIDNGNVKDVMDVLADRAPDIKRELDGAGLMHDALARWLDRIGGKEAKEARNTLRIERPGGLTFMLDAQSRLVGYALELAWRRDEKAEPESVSLEYRVEPLEQPPAFQWEPPANPRPFTDILDLLVPRPAD
jgi:hypothetical protein